MGTHIITSEPITATAYYDSTDSAAVSLKTVFTNREFIGQSDVRWSPLVVPTLQFFCREKPVAART
jgi:hypothetical protein